MIIRPTPPQLVIGVGFDSLKIHHVKMQDGDGKVLETYGPGDVPAGDPWWNLPAPNGCVSAEISYTRTSAAHHPGVGFRKA